MNREISSRRLVEVLAALAAALFGTSAVLVGGGREAVIWGGAALFFSLMLVYSLRERRRAGRARPVPRAPGGVGAWYLGAAIPGGIATWASFLYVGLRARRPLWVAFAVMYLTAFLVVVNLPSDAYIGADDGVALSSVLAIALWAVGLVHAYSIHSEVEDRLGSSGRRTR